MYTLPEPDDFDHAKTLADRYAAAPQERAQMFKELPDEELRRLTEQARLAVDVLLPHYSRTPIVKETDNLRGAFWMLIAGKNAEIALAERASAKTEKHALHRPTALDVLPFVRTPAMTDVLRECRDDELTALYWDALHETHQEYIRESEKHQASVPFVLRPLLKFLSPMQAVQTPRVFELLSIAECAKTVLGERGTRPPLPVASLDAALRWKELLGQVQDGEDMTGVYF
jgi:hypothetical protein